MSDCRRPSKLSHRHISAAYCLLLTAYCLLPTVRSPPMKPGAGVLFLMAAMAVAAAPAFEPIQPDVLAAAGTFVNAFADYDGDGDPDLFVGFNGAPNRLY